MKKILMVLTSALLASGFSNCLLTDHFMAPPSSKSGAEIKAEVNSAAFTGFLLATQLFDLTVTVGSTTAKVKPKLDADVMDDALVAGIVAQATAGINDDEYYTAKSAEECVSAVQTQTMLGYMLLASSPPTGEYAFAMTDGAIAGGACELEETGSVIQLSDSIKL